MNAISISAGTQRAVPTARILCRRYTSKGRAGWRPSRGDSGSGKLLRGLLVLAAAAGFGYGLLLLVDLVQNCALFVAGVGRLI